MKLIGIYFHLHGQLSECQINRHYFSILMVLMVVLFIVNFDTVEES